MRIGVAQTRPFKGDILRNIEAHLRLIEIAAKARADMIIFPELSITGYEPGMAAGLATTAEDVRLDIFETLSERYSMTIGVGIPATDEAGVRITEVIFPPGQPRQTYSKQYLHADEEPYFICGTKPGFVKGGRIALAICYELSVPAHSEQARRGGAEIYLVSVAKTKSGMERAAETLANIAKRYSMTVLVSNCVGHCDNFDCGGGSAAWNREGVKLAELDGAEEGILVLDTETGEVIIRQEYTPYLHAGK
ncbi:MAG TPA: carbon-nitrogen hydrolase family protein [Puia sp.]|jgi:predicted amidohydrolase|nr:carbon-nitrogen hydrolase family protein [Puia sp.]